MVDSSSAPKKAAWWQWALAIAFCVVFAIGFKALTAADVGEKCGGATGCASGLECIQMSAAMGDVVENRRCRKRCDTAATCPGDDRCVPVGGSKISVCMPRTLP